jgi:hypothetical protein
MNRHRPHQKHQANSNSPIFWTILVQQKVDAKSESHEDELLQRSEGKSSNQNITGDILTRGQEDRKHGEPHDQSHGDIRPGRREEQVDPRHSIKSSGLCGGHGSSKTGIPWTSWRLPSLVKNRAITQNFVAVVVGAGCIIFLSFAWKFRRSYLNRWVP